MRFLTKKTIAFALLMLAMTSCKKDFVAINTNPNGISVAAPQSLIGPAVYKVINANISSNLRINNEFMQVTVTTNDNREFHRYEVRPAESESMWRNWYVQLTNVRDIYASALKGKQKGFEVYQGISLVLDVWISSLITDMFGDAPYFASNAGYTESNTTPVFEKQVDIYSDLFLKLERANQLLKTTETVETANTMSDPIFKADALKWRKFANSLYLRLLLRVAHKPELNAQAKIKEILETNVAEYPIMQSNEDSAILRFTGEQPYLNPYFNARDIDFNGDKGYAEFFINNLMELGDPRLPLWATQASLGVYGGMQSAYKKGNVPERQSTLHLNLKSEPLMGNIMNYAELKFILAECSLRGYASLDTESLYKEGVRASINLWNKTIDDTYFDNLKVGLLNTDSVQDKLKKVHLQKYFALLFTDFQQWYEYRRTGLLALYTGPSVLNDGKMPVRLNYPLITQSLNKKNYDVAVQRMGGDGINVVMWWQPTLK